MPRPASRKTASNTDEKKVPENLFDWLVPGANRLETLPQVKHILDTIQPPTKLSRTDMQDLLDSLDTSMTNGVEVAAFEKMLYSPEIHGQLYENTRESLMTLWECIRTHKGASGSGMGVTDFKRTTLEDLMKVVNSWQLGITEAELLAYLDAVHRQAAAQSPYDVTPGQKEGGKDGEKIRVPPTKAGDQVLINSSKISRLDVFKLILP